MSRIKLSFGHFEGNAKNPKLVFQRVDTTIKGILILLLNVAAAAAAIAAFVNSLFNFKRKN